MQNTVQVRAVPLVLDRLLSETDKAVPLESNVDLPGGLPDDQIVKAALEKFFRTVFVSMPDYFEFQVWRDGMLIN
jgi:hypothetical protein